MEVVTNRRIDIACVQSGKFKSKGCRSCSAKGNRYKLFSRVNKQKIDGETVSLV